MDVINAPGMGGSATVTAPAPQPVETQDTPVQGSIPQQPMPQQPTLTPQMAEIQHHALIGKVFSNILGNNTSYAVGPDGQMQATQTPNKPGQFFKAVLAASLLGGEAGANGNPRQGFLGGLVRGGTAEVQEQQRQDLLKRAQAQQDFNNENTAAKEAREAKAFITQEQLRKAQIAQANAETYRSNVLTQGSDFDTHKKTADMGETHFADYKAAGLEPVFKDVSESEMKDTLAGRPGASTLDWEATGVKTNPDGSHEYTYSAYDPKGQIPVSQATLDQWKKDGMDKFYPDLFKVLKPGANVDATQYIALKQKDAQLYNDNLLRTKNDLDTQKKQADIGNVKSETAEHYAQANKARTETEKTRSEMLGAGSDSDSTPNPEQIADAIHAGKGTLEGLTSGMGKEAAAFRRQVEAVFLKKYPTDNLEAFKAWGRQAEHPGTQAQLTNARSLFGADGQPGSLDVLEQALRAVPKAPMPMLSKLRQNTAYDLGSTQMATVKALKTDLSTELAKFNTAGGSASTDHQIELYKEQLNEAQTPEQVEHVLQDIRKISSQRLHSIVGLNPYIKHMSTDINDPVSRQPIGGVDRAVQAGSMPSLPKGSGGQIDPQTAATYLQAAGGDKVKARAMAAQNNWKF
jgi:hypothetical protein